MINTIMIEDSYTCQETLINLLKSFCPEINLLGVADNITDGIQLIKSHQPDLLFLDVELGDVTAFDLLKSMPTIDFNIIFVSAFEHYSLQAIKYSAIDYLLKPIDPDQLIQAIEKIKKTNQLEHLSKQVEILMQHFSTYEKIALPSPKGLIFAKVEDIFHCQSDGSYTKVKLIGENREVLISRNLGELEKLLPPDIFYRIHKSHLINTSYIKEYINSDGGSIVLENGTHVPIARNRKNAFLEFLRKT